jgi:Flp pilus assembly protein TadG
MVEFALVGPIAFLLLLGTIVLGVIVLHEIQLTQAVRDGARAAAICGSQTDATVTPPALPPQLPDGSSCTSAHIVAYINTRVAAVDPVLAGKAYVTVYCDGSVSTSVSSTGVTPCANGSIPAGGVGSNTGTAASTCMNGYTVEVSITYQQPLYLPLVGNVLGNSGGNTRLISAKGEATCERGQ